MKYNGFVKVHMQYRPYADTLEFSRNLIKMLFKYVHLNVSALFNKVINTKFTRTSDAA